MLELLGALTSVLLTAFYFLLGAAGFGTNCLASRGDWSRHPDAAGVSFMLLVFCGLSVASVMAFGKPDGFRGFPFMDIVGGLYVLRICVARFAWWKLVLTFLFLLQLVFHAGFWWGWPTPLSDDAYLANLNAVYTLQVVTAASPGGVHGVKTLLAWLRHRPVARHHSRNGFAR